MGYVFYIDIKKVLKNMIVYVDEVGCASIFGPVLTCAVAIPESFQRLSGIKDSKQLTKKKRNELYEQLISVLHAFGSSSPKEIEIFNIHFAKYKAMKRAVEKLARTIKIDKVIVDGKFIIPDLDFPQEAVIKADDKFYECSVASILAKVKRDRAMTRLGEIEKYSYYGLESNAGYYSPAHRLGIIKYGPTELHRKNFKYFQYCLDCHLQYQEFLKQGKTLEEYLQYEKEESNKLKKSYFVIWKEHLNNSWKPIKWG